jgi:hypothetical protein
MPDSLLVEGNTGPPFLMSKRGISITFSMKDCPHDSHEHSGIIVISAPSERPLNHCRLCFADRGSFSLSEQQIRNISHQARRSWKRLFALSSLQPDAVFRALAPSGWPTTRGSNSTARFLGVVPNVFAVSIHRALNYCTIIRMNERSVATVSRVARHFSPCRS